MRKLRYVPEKTMVEVTDRTIHGRFLLLPTPLLKKIAIGALGRAQRLHGVRIFGFACLSNHFHALLEVDDAEQLSRFMGCFLSKLAREVGRLYGWKETVFPQEVPVDPGHGRGWGPDRPPEIPPRARL